MNASADNVVSPAVAEVNSLVERVLRSLDEFQKLNPRSRLIISLPKPPLPRWTNMVYSPCTRSKKRDAVYLKTKPKPVYLRKRRAPPA